LKRQEIAIPSTTWNIYPGDASMGVIQVNIIAATTPDEIQNAAADLQSRGASRLVLDLRNNGGGLLESGVDTARLFLKDGIVITQQYKNQDPQVFRVDKPGSLADIPLAVLVNHNTASAAEIISGALQSQGRAALIGTNTYGKDTIQLVFEMEDGSSLHVTSARWWLPGKEAGIAGIGLTPDWPVQEDANNPAAFFNAALAALNK
jgi:carboxyl-terminal processing protease